MRFWYLLRCSVSKSPQLYLLWYRTGRNTIFSRLNAPGIYFKLSPVDPAFNWDPAFMNKMFFFCHFIKLTYFHPTSKVGGERSGQDGTISPFIQCDKLSQGLLRITVTIVYRMRTTVFLQSRYVTNRRYLVRYLHGQIAPSQITRLSCSYRGLFVFWLAFTVARLTLHWSTRILHFSPWAGSARPPAPQSLFLREWSCIDNSFKLQQHTQTAPLGATK